MNMILATSLLAIVVAGIILLSWWICFRTAMTNSIDEAENFERANDWQRGEDHGSVDILILPTKQN